MLLAGLGGAALMRRRRPDAEAMRDADHGLAPMPIKAEPVMVPFAAMARPARHGVTISDPALAAMVAAPPSADNPFLTQAKRVRRARFLLAQQQATAQAPMADAVAPAAAPLPTVDRSQTVYRFGTQRSTQGFLKPRTR